MKNVTQEMGNTKTFDVRKRVRELFRELLGTTESEQLDRVADSIITGLSRRFRRVPKSIKDEIKSITDIDRLDELDDHVLDCYTPKDFIRVLRPQQQVMPKDKKGAWAMWYEKGIAEGEVRGRAGTIIRFLGHRFQKVPKSIKDKVSSITDINRLDELTDQAADCRSLAEFSKSLQSQQ